MFARSTCKLFNLSQCVSRASRLHGTGNWHQSNHIAFHKLLAKPPSTLFLRIRQKSTAPAELLWACRWMWNKMFDKYLLTTNIISSGVLMVIGDILAQEVERLHLPSPDGSRYDYHRIGRMFVVGALQGPVHHYVYLWMDKVLPGTSLRNIGSKILIDQLVMSPLCILMFFYSACFLEKKSISETNQELVTKFPYIYLVDWVIWPAAQYINFRFLETKYRVIYVNVVTALYNVFISYMKHAFEIEDVL